MSGIHIVTTTLVAIVAFGTSSFANADSVDMNVRMDLERVAQKRIFFGHQSVGVNLLDGIKQLSVEAGVPIRILEVKSATDVQPAMIGHSFVAENGNPIHKLVSFEKAMGQHRTDLDIAIVKFCFVDFNADTDVKELFARYKTTISMLRSRNPGTTFVHVTAPLTTVESGIKIRIKQALGSAPPGTVENLRREEYNALLRQAYQNKEPIFDLARFESTARDGSPVTVKYNHMTVPVMPPEYSDDGGHLNVSDQRRAARELISVLAAIPDRVVAR